MSLIQGIIPPRAYERIRDKICQVLALEFQGQFLLSGDYDLQDVKIFMERLVPFDHTELPALNVGIERGDYVSYHQGQAEGDYRFFIESNTKGETDDELRGDTKSKILVQKIMGIAMAILTDPLYNTLGFAKGDIIRHRHIEGFVFAESTRQDAENVTMARQILVVKAIETNALLDPGLIAGQDTHVKLHDTDKGYYWSIDF